jgi:CubicO group peptidase (beta-lactamase class C family)
MNRNLFRPLIWTLLLACLMSCRPKQEKILQRSLPEKEGMRTEGILRFLEEVQAQRIDLHSLMILRHGKVVAEGWRYPYSSGHRHIMHSVSKTFTSAAIGFAVDEKLLTADDRVISFFPDKLPPGVSPFLEELTVRHLLTMSVGQDPAPSFALTDGDWVKLFLATPIVHRPGTVFLYNSYASHVLSAIIGKVTGQTVFEYLRPRLFEPLEMKDVRWETDASGNSMGGWGMRIRTEDMAKFGQLYLQQGRWKGRQLLSEAWIKEATSVQIYQRDSLTVEEELHDNWAQGYGYQIWRCINNAYRADGANGQFIIVMPGEDAVVVITENTGNTQEVLRLVFKHLQPAMTNSIYAMKDEDREALQSLLSDLSVPDPFRTAEGVELPGDTVRSYAMEANGLQIQSATFTFGREGDCRLTLDIAGTSHTLPFGPDTWRYGETAKESPYFLSPRRNPAGLAPFPTAGYGSWASENELRLRLLFTEDYQEETYVCRFDGDRLEMTVDNSAGALHHTVVTGRLQ